MRRVRAIVASLFFLSVVAGRCAYAEDDDTGKPPVPTDVAYTHKAPVPSDIAAARPPPVANIVDDAGKASSVPVTADTVKPAVSSATAERYPTLRVLDFTVCRRIGVELQDDYNCPQPLNVNGVSLSKPEELPIDLPTVLKLAGCDNLDFRIACAKLDEAHAKTLAAKMEFLPSLHPEFENRWHSGREQNSRGVFFNVPKQSNKFGGEAVLNWQLGETVFRVLAARRRAQAQEAAAQVAVDDAKYKAVTAFYNLVQARTDLAIASERLKQADETVSLIGKRAQTGAALTADVKRAEAARAEVKQRVAQARNKARIASLNLTEVLHIDPLVTLIPHQESQDLIALVPVEKDLVPLIADGIVRRPELKESRAYWNALDKERKAAFFAPLVPAIRAELFNGSFGHDPADAHHRVDAELSIGWKIGAGGIGDVSRKRISEAAQQAEAIRFAKIADIVAREVVESQANVKTAQELIDLSKEEIAAAQETLRLTNERLKVGAVLTLDVLTAEDVLFNAKSRAAQYVNDYNRAQYSLLRSIGGFRESDE